MKPDRHSNKKGLSQSQWKAIFATSILAGTLDALGAVIVYQANPARLFRFIASGAFGAGKAFSEGTLMVVWGILFHYLIALIWTAIFFFIYPRLAIARRSIVFTGTLYGIFVWIAMNRIVIPFSEIAQGPFNFRAALIGASIIVVAIGLPIAFLTRWYYSKKGTYRDAGV
jgi:hypothetical protein